MTFELLAQNIESIQTALQQQAAHAVNLSLTARNWLVGWYKWSMSRTEKTEHNMVRHS